MTGEILCIGEILWDALPPGLFLGGAPFNVAGHLHALGLPAAVISRVGKDRLGREVIARLERRGIATDLIQVDPELETGFVAVSLDASGVPSYEILNPVAWDRIELLPGLVDRVRRSAAVVFGSLAQRSEVSRATIAALCEVGVPKVFDVNLRKPYDDSIVRRSLEVATVVKMNEEELEILTGWFALPVGLEASMRALAAWFDCHTVCVTRGSSGAALLRDGRWSEHSGFRVDVKDTVGSGDAFLAGLLAGLIAGRDDESVLQHANLLGAYVATQFGAIPTYEQEVLALIKGMNQQSPQSGGPGGPGGPAFHRHAAGGATS